MSLEGMNRKVFRGVRLFPYGVALGTVAVAIGVTLLVCPWIHSASMLLFLSGLGCGFLAAILSVQELKNREQALLLEAETAT